MFKPAHAASHVVAIVFLIFRLHWRLCQPILETKKFSSDYVQYHWTTIHAHLFIEPNDVHNASFYYSSRRTFVAVTSSLYFYYRPKQFPPSPWRVNTVPLVLTSITFSVEAITWRVFDKPSGTHLGTYISYSSCEKRLEGSLFNANSFLAFLLTLTRTRRQFENVTPKSRATIPPTSFHNAFQKGCMNALGRFNFIARKAGKVMQGILADLNAALRETL